MIQQVYQGEKMTADKINELVNWCNDFNDLSTAYVLKVKEQIKDIVKRTIKKETVEDLTQVIARISALERLIPTLPQQFYNDFCNMLLTVHLHQRVVKRNVDTTLFDNGEIKLIVETDLTLSSTETKHKYTYHENDTL